MYQAHRIDAYTDLSALVVEGIGLHVEDIPVSLVLSIIISWTFRTMAHEENQYSYIYKIIGNFFCLKHSNRLKPGLRVSSYFLNSPFRHDFFSDN